MAGSFLPSERDDLSVDLKLMAFHGATMMSLLNELGNRGR